MPTLPVISRGRTLLYPLQLTRVFPTKLLQFLDDSEQRWKAQPAQDKFVLTYNDIDGYSVSVLREFWLGSHGPTASFFDVQVGETTYSGMAFDDDVFKVTQSKPNLFTVTLNLRKVA